MVTTLLGEAMDSEGLAADRYAIYLDGLEAAQNKATASWEAMMSATVKGDLVKWYYDASAGLFDFITNLGGLDTVLIGVSAALITYTAGAGLASTASLGLAGSLEFLWLAVAASPVGVALAIGAMVTALVGLQHTINETAQTAIDTWSLAMDEFTTSTKSSLMVVGELEKEIDRLNDMTVWDAAMSKNYEVIRENLKKTISLVGETSDSWSDYSRSIERALSAAGYEMDEQGKIYRELFDGTKIYLDEVDLLTESIFKAEGVTDSWSDRLEHLNGTVQNQTSSVLSAADADRVLLGEMEKLESATSSLDDEMLLLGDNFQSFINKTLELANGDSAIQSMMGEFTDMNNLYREEMLSTEEYFEQMENGIAQLDMTEMFGENQEAGLAFFEGLSVNAVQAISTINQEWENGDVSFTTYLENLSGASEMMLELGDMAAGFFGDNSLAAESMTMLSDATDELNQRLEVNVTTRELMRQVVQQELEFGTTEYNKAMLQQSKIMAQSGITYTNVKGDALRSANEIYGYMVETDGNFQRLSSQTANATQTTMKNAAVGASKLLNGIADAIDSFEAQINFVPEIIPGSIDVMGRQMSLPGVKFNISGSGVGDILRSASAELEAWNPEEIDSSVYTQGAGDTPFEGAGDDYEHLGGTVGSLTNAFKELGETSGKSADKIKEDAHSINKLLDMVVAKLKQEAKARKDSLKQQLKDYKKIIDARKKSLKLAREEHDYQEKLEDKQSDMARIQGELEELRLDDSEEAAAKRRALEEEAKELQDEIDEDSFDREIELQGDALDAEYDSFKDYIDSQIAAIDDYLSKPGLIVSQALAMIETQGEDLYKSLIEYNSIYGSGITNDVTSAWEDAMAALEEYGGLLSEITGNGGSPFAPEFSPSPNANSNSGSGGGGGGNQPLLDSIFNQPEFESNRGNNGLSIDGGLMNFNVAGNLDTAVLPDIDRIANATIAKLNDILGMRGKVRQAQQFAS